MKSTVSAPPADRTAAVTRLRAREFVARRPEDEDRRIAFVPIRRPVAVLWIALLVLFLVALATAFYVGQRATAAAGALTQVRADLADFQRSAEAGTTAGDGSVADASAAAVRNADAAVAASDGPVWAAYEHVPVLGANLRAIRETALSLAPLTNDGVRPLAAALSGDRASLGGGSASAPLPDRVLAATSGLGDALSRATARIDRIDVSGTLPQFSDSVEQVHDGLAAATRTADSWNAGGAMLRRALGESGAKQYLLVLSRPKTADAFFLVRLDGGRVVARKLSAADLGPGAPRNLSGAAPRRFGRVASTLRGAWNDSHAVALDGVVLADADLLPAMLKATGPVRASSGTTVSARTVQASLRKDPAAFARTALPAMLTALYQGRGAAAAFLAQTPTAAEAGLVRIWVGDSRTMRAVSSARLDGAAGAGRP